jgi:hypothetical protein
MTEFTCVMDDHDKPRRALDGLDICAWHYGRCERAVAEIPALYESLGRRLVPGSSGLTGMPRAGRDPGLNLNPRIVTLRADTRNTLSTWARIAVEERRMTTPADTIPAMAAFIAAQIDWYAHHEGTRQFVNDMIGTHGDARRLNDPSHVRTFEVAPCPEDGCEGVLVARLRSTDALLPHDVTCDSSPLDDEGAPVHYWPADKWMTLGRRIVRRETA